MIYSEIILRMVLDVFTFYIKLNNLVKNLEIVMPGYVSGTGQARYGIRNVLNVLDSGFRRNDGEFFDFLRVHQT